jgi:hypothetical protein
MRGSGSNAETGGPERLARASRPASRTAWPPIADELLEVRRTFLRAGDAPAPRSRTAGARAELIHVLRLPDFERADRIGEFWGHPETRTFGELLIDLEEDRYAKAVVWGLLREMERG